MNDGSSMKMCFFCYGSSHFVILIEARSGNENRNEAGEREWLETVSECEMDTNEYRFNQFIMH